MFWAEFLWKLFKFIELVTQSIKTYVHGKYNVLYRFLLWKKISQNFNFARSSLYLAEHNSWVWINFKKISFAVIPKLKNMTLKLTPEKWTLYFKVKYKIYEKRHCFEMYNILFELCGMFICKKIISILFILTFQTDILNIRDIYADQLKIKKRIRNSFEMFLFLFSL